jgi:hypothetical protein
MSHAIQLCANCIVNFRHVMAVNIAPQAAHAIEIFPPFAVDEAHSVGVGDNQRIIREPLPHVRKWMPDELFIELLKFLGFGVWHWIAQI